MRACARAYRGDLHVISTNVGTVQRDTVRVDGARFTALFRYIFKTYLIQANLLDGAASFEQEVDFRFCVTWACQKVAELFQVGKYFKSRGYITALIAIISYR